MIASILTLLQIAGLFISVFGAWWVWQDAKRLKQHGVILTPGLWATVVFLLWCVGLPAYLLLRRFSWKKQMGPTPDVAKEFE